MNVNVLLPQFTTAGLFTVSSANAFAVGPNGLTNPTFNVVTNVSSAATGLSITGNAAGAGVTLTALSSGSDESIILVAKGAGVINHSSSVQFNSLPIAFGFTNTALSSVQTLGIKAGDGSDPVLLLLHAYTNGSTWDGGWITTAHRALNLYAGSDGSAGGGDVNIGSPFTALDTTRFLGDVTFAGSLNLKSSTTDAQVLSFQAHDTDGGVYRTVMAMINGNTPTLAISPDSGAAVTVEATTLRAISDTGGSASKTTLTNATNTTVTNAYVVNGGQAATTSNTGWVKIYVGTTVAWMPYWANATP